MLSNDISGLGEKKKSLDKKKDFLKNRLQRHHQCNDTLSSFLDAQQGGGKVKGEEENVDRGGCPEGKREVVIRGERIFEIGVNYDVIYR